MFNRLKLGCFCVLSIHMQLAIANDFQTKILYVYDGDTVKIQQGLGTYRLRISDIDAPERNQAYGKKARRALMTFCKHAAISIDITGTDQYQRKLGQLQCNGQSVSQFMVANGHAWFYQRYSNNPFLADAESNARQQKLGLWHQKNPKAPWLWRKQNLH
jgi:micrococcal nuclease